MKIYAVHNNTASRYYRLVPQLKHMQEQGHKVILEPHNDKHMGEHINWADVIIFQMALTRPYIKIAKKLGKKVIFECDDLIHIVPPTHYNYKDTRGIKNRANWWKRIYGTMSLCDGFIATNDELIKKYGWMAKKKLMYPNYCDLSHWLKPYKPNTTDRIRLLWAGSTSHTGDLQMIKPVLNKILTKYPQVQFIYIGTGGIKTQDLNAQFIYGKDLFEGLPDNRESILAMTGNLYPYTLAGLQADIAIAPLENNYFNKFKSQCKYLEYSINKIPAIHSGWFYEGCDKAVLADTENEWVDALSMLIESKRLRSKIGKGAYEDVINNHNIDNKLSDWQAFVENI